MARVYFDLETIPAQRQELADVAILRAQAKTDEPLTVHEADDAYRATALNGVFGEIVSIGFAIDDQPVQSVTRPDLTPDGEARMLKAFWSQLRGLRSVQWIGYNIAAFDIPFLFQRCVVHGVKPSVQFPPDTAPWKGEVQDLMVTLCGFRNRVKFDDACLALGVPSPKTDMDGSQVWDAIQAGMFEQVATYARADVEATRLMHKRLTFQAVELEPSSEGVAA